MSSSPYPKFQSTVWLRSCSGAFPSSSHVFTSRSVFPVGLGTSAPLVDAAKLCLFKCDVTGASLLVVGKNANGDFVTYPPCKVRGLAVNRDLDQTHLPFLAALTDLWVLHGRCRSVLTVSYVRQLVDSRSATRLQTPVSKACKGGGGKVIDSLKPGVSSLHWTVSRVPNAARF